MSHPSWVRGLKQHRCRSHFPKDMSHPSWVRGLKPVMFRPVPSRWSVAPLVGAWIETKNYKSY